VGSLLELPIPIATPIPTRFGVGIEMVIPAEGAIMTFGQPNPDPCAAP
jgi:hypothetical protein